MHAHASVCAMSLLPPQYDQPDALRKAKEFANRAVAKWESTTNKVEVLG